jgi:hypothetical protein
MSALQLKYKYTVIKSGVELFSSTENYKYFLCGENYKEGAQN